MKLVGLRSLDKMQSSPTGSIVLSPPFNEPNTTTRQYSTSRATVVDALEEEEQDWDSLVSAAAKLSS